MRYFMTFLRKFLSNGELSPFYKISQEYQTVTKGAGIGNLVTVFLSKLLEILLISKKKVKPVCELAG
jgi:hypothetical protein